MRKIKFIEKVRRIILIFITLNSALIKGITAASFGSALSSLVFISTNEFLLNKYFKDYKLNVMNLKFGNINQAKKLEQLNKDFNWKKAIIKSYIISDILKSIIFLPFEARKQRIQLCQASEYMYNSLFYSNTIRAMPLYIIRDCLTRLISFGLFFNYMDATFSPRLK